MTGKTQHRSRVLCGSIVLASCLLGPALRLLGDDARSVSGRWLIDFEVLVPA